MKVNHMWLICRLLLAFPGLSFARGPPAEDEEEKNSGGCFGPLYRCLGFKRKKINYKPLEDDSVSYRSVDSLSLDDRDPIAEDFRTAGPMSVYQPGPRGTGFERTEELLMNSLPGDSPSFDESEESKRYNEKMARTAIEKFGKK
ncbi:hypothetical protein FOZ61_002226 [Perkinsus olseni]|uniref:Uncharacterized protein n=1 Tax=Perkinsus olseni TaxID=32597 RepID=A0A7J6LUT3_PEROL|nr:hypothetical protein FOZ61_002226 [Perkinsus olseni]